MQPKDHYLSTTACQWACLIPKESVVAFTLFSKAHFNIVLPHLSKSSIYSFLEILHRIVCTFLSTRYTVRVTCLTSSRFLLFGHRDRRLYRGADKSLARPGRKQANVSVRMAWISFGALPCKKKKSWWQLASRCCWNRARPWHAS